MPATRIARLLLAACVALAGCTSPPRVPSGPNLPKVRSEHAALMAQDGWALHGDFISSSAARRAVVLLHQRNGSAADWLAIEGDLVNAGFAVLAIDQRGAGRSTGPRNGPDAPWVTTPDLAAADAWLQARGFAPERIGFVGASYGANNALVYASSRTVAPPVALLSPGRSYHGVAVEPAARAFKGYALVLAAREDAITEGGPQIIARVLGSRASVEMFDGDAHGTALLGDKEPAKAAILRFLKTRL